MIRLYVKRYPIPIYGKRHNQINQDPIQLENSCNKEKYYFFQKSEFICLNFLDYGPRYNTIKKALKKYIEEKSS